MDPELRFDLLEVGPERGLVDAADAVAPDPLVEHVVRGAVAGARVDRGGAPDAAPERNRDRRSAERAGEPAVSVEEVDHRARVAGEVLAGEKASLLDEHDVAPAGGELAGHDGAARARADHDHVGELVDVVRDACPVDGHARAPSRTAWCAALGPARSFSRRCASS